MRRLDIALLVLIAHVAGGCATFHDVPAPPLTLPGPQAVDQIRVIYRHADKKPEIVLSDRRRIAALLAFVAQRNQNWRTPWDTFPSGEYTVILEAKGGKLLALWISPGWIGGRDFGQDSTGNRLRDISREDWATLTDLLGIPPDTDD